jgi:uncharacterized protein DUF4339
VEPAQEELWYYINPAHQDPVGPIPGEQMRGMLATGKISKRTLVWKEGMEAWEEAGKVAQLQRTERVAVDPKFLKKKQ